ncbi:MULTISPECIES: NAD(P)/FAD-dependent oxidoreductase [Clostridia]|uniref:NAD(P)/FAD-dependent oxidoreductase n=1 Tax=Clostridia TaxID=186801 RepID=UPI000EB546A2|nr:MULTISPECIES: NAD(P)/FAD-dependent oxidoreductase [Clostridia]RKQ32136.1 NAD(P)/FAD-dependent oxidoreductase [Ruminococcus sp. B05]TAP36379.1 NAD(P)/FAD-dependent oxidoreductase [Mediterraneibacter sp. gm002]
MSKVIVIGGGAAGTVAAIFAARNGHRVELFEKNEKIGKKLFITGKGRCNVTNAGDMDALFDAVKSNPKFLYSAFYSFTNEQAMDFFEELGVRLKVERGNRVFPQSDHSSDIINALKHELERLGVEIHLCTEVKDVLVEHEKFTGIVLKNRKKVSGDACVVATGGISYASTGSTGDGYRFAEKTGHKVTELYPSLVPMEVKEWYAKELQGLSLRNIQGTILDGNKKLYEEFGEMLFTHYGVSGPIIISASSVVGKKLQDKELTLKIDLKPALSREQLDQRVLRDFEENKNKQFKNAVDKLFPAKLKPIMIELSGISPEKKVNEISKEERLCFVDLIKNFKMTLTGLRSYNEAIITKGGVSVKDIDPGTMESKKISGLYYAGEVLDLDALTGGFNLQIAWSTGYLAGISIQ